MLNALERLMSGHVGWRIFNVSLCLFVAAFICWWHFIQPRQQHLRQQQQIRHSWQRIVSQQRQIAALPKREPLPEAVLVEPFSALEAVKRSGGQLVKWQPAPRRSVLEILLPWPKVPLFFQQIACYPGLKMPTFVLSGAGEQIRVLLTLEVTDENI